MEIIRCFRTVSSMHYVICQDFRTSVLYVVTVFSVASVRLKFAYSRHLIREK